MIGRLHLKIVFSIVLLAGLGANQCGLAKEAHAQHTGASAKRANSVHSKPAEGIDTSVTVLSPRGGFARVKQNSSASPRPENSTRRSNVIGAIKSPVARNAIGQPIKSKNLTANAPHLTPSLQAKGTVANNGPRVSRPGSPVFPLNVGRANVHPNTTASNSSNGRINGARLIRLRLVR